MAQSDKILVRSLKERAYHLLLKHGIQDRFTLKIKEPKNKEWVATYRSYSQFNNGGRGPIFWISPELLDNPSEFVISILHEYGHVIAEYAWIKSPALKDLIRTNWEGRFFMRPWDEEEFAEEFARYVYSNFSLYDKELNEVISSYTSSLYE